MVRTLTVCISLGSLIRLTKPNFAYQIQGPGKPVSPVRDIETHMAESGQTPLNLAPEVVLSENAFRFRGPATIAFCRNAAITRHDDP